MSLPTSNWWIGSIERRKIEFHGLKFEINETKFSNRLEMTTLILKRFNSYMMFMVNTHVKEASIKLGVLRDAAPDTPVNLQGLVCPLFIWNVHRLYQNGYILRYFTIH